MRRHVGAVVRDVDTIATGRPTTDYRMAPVSSSAVSRPAIGRSAARMAGSIVILVLFAACSSLTGTAAREPTTTTSPISAAVTNSLLAVESSLLASISSPTTDFQHASADAAQALQQMTQSQANQNSALQTASQQATSICLRDGFGSPTCMAANERLAAAGTGQSQGFLTNLGQATQRAGNDLGAEVSDLRQIAASCLTAATSLAAIQFPPTVRADAQAVETALTNNATAAQDAAGVLSSNPGLVQPAINRWQGASNTYRVALTTLHTDLGMPPPQ